MRVLLLSPYPDTVARILRDAGDTAYVWENAVLPKHLDFDWIVSYGHRHILREPVLTAMPGRIINLHIGYLPYNRGADPNFWSWHDGTPKGVTIHQIDAGIDTGHVLCRMRTPDLILPEELTLKQSYEQLHKDAVFLFRRYWPAIKAEKMGPLSQKNMPFTSHKKKDREAIWHHFPLGWDTPCKAVAEFGEKWRTEQVLR